MNPAHGSVPAASFDLRIDRTRSLPGRVWHAPRPRALVAVAHGLGEHCGRYAALASDLVRAGFTVAAVDFPGHGDAQGPRGDVPSWPALRDAVLPALLRASESLDGIPAGLPRLLLGHSMGGVLALDFALAHPREIVAVVASAPGLKSSIPPWWKLALANVARAAAPSVGFPTGLDEGGMSRDPEVERLRDEDVLVHGRISPRLYFAFTEAQQRVLRDARRLAVPALVMHGDADRVVDPDGSRLFHTAAPRDFATLMLYPGAFHELFNDPAREQAVPDLVAWLEARLAAARAR